MTDAIDPADLSLWRNYRQGKVGVQTHDHELLLSPAEARALADGLLRDARIELAPDHSAMDQAHKIAEALHECADDVDRTTDTASAAPSGGGTYGDGNGDGGKQ